MLVEGTRIHVLVRRLFAGDLRRHFVGEVLDASGGLARVSGFGFVFDEGRNRFIRCREEQERLVALDDARNLVTLLPDDLDPAVLQLWVSSGRRVTLTDGDEYSLEISELDGG